MGFSYLMLNWLEWTSFNREGDSDSFLSEWVPMVDLGLPSLPVEDLPEPPSEDLKNAGNIWIISCTTLFPTKGPILQPLT